ncbi:T9SS type A sorting domain-containing protein [Hymenobacter gummosus]|uniref:T9SS type A sorting domain-containing protein n=1 Tax=Hymenobacter gummosus TaxID=1776032 RepID=A0A431U6B8_9BACT|nr:T9SS type A sorting domain-containing protein [Hymenobacter gummosus]RTQ52218.1 T9SS type A sorting domain-containing protein [Hymenobacter gummosus]
MLLPLSARALCLSMACSLGLALQLRAQGGGQATFGTDTGPEVVVNHADANGVYEALYLRSAFRSITQGGHIVQLAFDKGSGTDTSPLTNVVLYLRNANGFNGGTLDTTGYQRVFQGSFANTSSAIQTVRLDRSFYYDYAGGLSVLILRRGGNVNNVAGQRALFRGGFGQGQATARAGSGAAAFPAASTVLTTSTTVANLAVFYGPATAARPARAALGTPPSPQPATDVVALDLPDLAGGPVRAQLTDACGRVVTPPRAVAARGQRWELPLAGLAPGLYLLQLRSGQQHTTWRVLKQ